MDDGKYVIIKHLGHEIAIMFHPLLAHSDIAISMPVVSAGFFTVNSDPSDIDKEDISVYVWGQSVSLKKMSRQKDGNLLKQALRQKVKY